MKILLYVSTLVRYQGTYKECVIKISNEIWKWRLMFTLSIIDECDMIFSSTCNESIDHP